MLFLNVTMKKWTGFPAHVLCTKGKFLSGSKAKSIFVVTTCCVCFRPLALKIAVDMEALHFVLILLFFTYRLIVLTAL